MKKVAFVHATVKVKNLLHKKSLVLDPVSAGCLSRVRDRDASRTETVLESVIRDLATVRLIDEIVVVTSFSACDDRVAAVVARCDVGTKVSCYRVDDNESYAITEQNKSSLGKEWPYERFPVYGAWHIDGLAAIAKVYAADVAFVVQADAAVYLNTSLCEEYLAKYTQKGIWIYAQGDSAYACAVVNVQFIAELARKHRSRIDGVVKKTREQFSWRLYSLLCMHMEDAGRTDFAMAVQAEDMPFAVLYDARELRTINACAQSDIAFLRTAVESGAVVRAIGDYPAFVEVELVDAQGTGMPAVMAERMCAEADRFGSVVNVRLLSWNAATCRQFLDAAPARAASFVMAELDAPVIEALDDASRELLATQVSLVQLNVTAETDPATIMPFCEMRVNGGSGRCFVVLCVRPYDVEKFFSFSAMVDRFVIKSSGGMKHEMDMIDFSPLERTVCKKLQTSLFVGADGAYAPCRFMHTVGTTGMNDCVSAFRSPALMAIRANHVAGRYQAEHACAACREWFIPDVIVVPKPYLWVKTVAYMPVPAAIADSVQELCVFAEELVRLRCSMIAYVEHSPLSVSHAVYTGLHRVMAEVGDRVCALGAVEKALDIWEEVLRYDPSNAKIHGELDRLLVENSVNG